MAWRHADGWRAGRGPAAGVLVLDSPGGSAGAAANAKRVMPSSASRSAGSIDNPYSSLTAMTRSATHASGPRCPGAPVVSDSGGRGPRRARPGADARAAPWGVRVQRRVTCSPPAGRPWHRREVVLGDDHVRGLGHRDGGHRGRGAARDAGGNPSAAAVQFSIVADLTPVPALPVIGTLALALVLLVGGARRWTAS